MFSLWMLALPPLEIGTMDGSQLLTFFLNVFISIEATPGLVVVVIPSWS